MQAKTARTATLWSAGGECVTAKALILFTEAYNKLNGLPIPPRPTNLFAPVRPKPRAHMAEDDHDHMYGDADDADARAYAESNTNDELEANTAEPQYQTYGSDTWFANSSYADATVDSAN